MLLQRNLYHAGIVTDDFEGTVQRLSREMGLTWSPRIEVDLPLWTRDHGTLVVRTKAVYSREEPCIEVVQSIRGTPIGAPEGRPLHHLGYWSDDLDRDALELEAAGAAKIMCAHDNGRMFGMAYFELSNGLLVELVDRTSFPDWNAFLAGEIEHEVAYPD